MKKKGTQKTKTMHPMFKLFTFLPRNHCASPTLPLKTSPVSSFFCSNYGYLMEKLNTCVIWKYNSNKLWLLYADMGMFKS